jgi:hypothetical protein
MPGLPLFWRGIKGEVLMMNCKKQMIKIFLMPGLPLFRRGSKGEASQQKHIQL